MTNFTLKGTEFHTIGTLPAVGSQAPDFTVTKTDLGEIHLKNYLGKKIVLNIFPSLDTSTCAAAIKHFNAIAAKHKDTLFLSISADLPFAQKRFCAAENLENVVPVSIFRHPQFAKDYGVLIIDGPLTGLLARAVIVINETGKIMYNQLVNELTEEPDYPKIEAVI